MASKRKVEMIVPAEESDQLHIRPLYADTFIDYVFKMIVSQIM